MSHSDESGGDTPAHEHNRRVWDQFARQQARFTKPAPDEQFKNPLAQIDGSGWLGGDIAGRSLLCLGSGGGRQSALYAAAGAKVTVVDISPAMLALDREVAAERSLEIRAVETSMDNLSMFNSGEFEIVSQPVSTCYVPDLLKVYREIARVVAPGGTYVSQHKQPGSLQADVESTANGYELIEPYYRDGPLPSVSDSRHREPGTLEYLHRWEELIGGLCRAGFVVEDLLEPLHGDPQAERGTFAHRSYYAAPYVRIKARRVGTTIVEQTSRMWLPDSE